MSPVVILALVVAFGLSALLMYLTFRERKDPPE